MLNKILISVLVAVGLYDLVVWIACIDNAGLESLELLLLWVLVFINFDKMWENNIVEIQSIN